MPHMIHRITLVSLLVVALSACESSDASERQAHADSVAAITADSTARAHQDSVNRTLPGYVIDSLLPVEEEIRRFRAATSGTPVATLTGGSPSRDALIARFVQAVAHSDTTALIRMTMSRREFIDLYYPESPHTHPPYRQSPGFLWGQFEMSSSTGLTRLLRRRGGRPLRTTGVVCDPKPQVEGANTLWSHCELIVLTDVERRERLFGTIIERDGQFKFLSLTNNY